MMQLESMIKIREGKIEEVVKKYNIDAVVNCANAPPSKRQLCSIRRVDG